MAMSVILVTGGFGYVGGRIARHLAASGHQVRVSTRRPAAGRPAWAGEVAVVGADPDCRGVDAVVHLAAMNEIDCAADPAGALVANGVDSVRLLGRALAAGVPRFLYFSTARVYGDPLTGRIDEDLYPRPNHPYGITHKVFEDYLLAEHAKGRIAGACLRLSNAVGAPADAGIDRWTLVANELCRQVAAAGRITMKSSGLAFRDFIPLGEVARAVEFLLGADLGAGVFNLGVGHSTLVRDLAELIADRAQAVLGLRPAIARPDPAPGEVPAPLDFRVDRLAAAGFTASRDLAEEIDRTLLLCRDAFAPPS
jgi:UDP-glucose 4-epimerase